MGAKDIIFYLFSKYWHQPGSGTMADTSEKQWVRCKKANCKGRVVHACHLTSRDGGRGWGVQGHHWPWSLRLSWATWDPLSKHQEGRAMLDVNGLKRWERDNRIQDGHRNVNDHFPASPCRVWVWQACATQNHLSFILPLKWVNNLPWEHCHECKFQVTRKTEFPKIGGGPECGGTPLLCQHLGDWGRKLMFEVSLSYKAKLPQTTVGEAREWALQGRLWLPSLTTWIQVSMVEKESWLLQLVLWFPHRCPITHIPHAYSYTYTHTHTHTHTYPVCPYTCHMSHTTHHTHTHSTHTQHTHITHIHTQYVHTHATHATHHTSHTHNIHTSHIYTHTQYTHRTYTHPIYIYMPCIHTHTYRPYIPNIHAQYAHIHMPHTTPHIHIQT